MNNNFDQSTTRVNGLFLFLQHIIDLLLKLKPIASEFYMFIHEYAKMHADEPAKLKQLDEFYMGYTSEKAVFWYTKNSFMHSCVNDALRTENIEMLYLCRFFIRDIRTQLSKNQCQNSVRVYRGQRMSKLELDYLPKLIDHLVVVKSILSTSTSRKIAEMFLSRSHDPQTDNQSEFVLFEIDADPQLCGNSRKPFAKITDLSNFDTEEEVLFMSGSIFLLSDVYHENGICIVKMSLWDFEKTELQPLLDVLGNSQTSLEDNKSPLDFISQLTNLNRDDIAVKLAKRYLMELTWNDATNHDDTVEIANCYYRLGFINLKQCQYDSAIEWFDHALKNFATIVPIDHLSTAATHISMGDTLTRKGDIKQARVEYRIALRIYEREYGIKHPKTAALRDNIVWHICIKGQRFRRLFDFSQPLLEMKDSILSTIRSEQLMNVFSEDQATAVNPLPAEDMVRQLHSIIHSNIYNVTDKSNSTIQNLRLHPLTNAIIASRHLFPFIAGIVTYQCPCCKEPVWVYRLFSMFKGSPCFRCIGKVLIFRRE
jgi:hypothetical protein